MSEFEKFELESLPFTTRLPRELLVQLKLRAIRSTIQVLVEHAYTLYLGGRLPPRMLGGYEWPEEFADNPEPPYLTSPMKGFTVRMPRHLLRWARVYAAEAEISEQQLAVKVFDWYVRTDHYPPNRESVGRNEWGRLDVPEPLLALEFEDRSSKSITRALDILSDRHQKYGGTLSAKPGMANPAKSAVEARLALGLDKPRPQPPIRRRLGKG